MPNPPLVVLIEDNVGDARWFWMQLREGGILCDVTTFNTGEAALEGLSEMPAPDLIVADWRLPMLDGAQLITALKRIPGLDRVPLAVLTGVGDLRSAASQAGAVCCLKKPLTPRDVETLLSFLHMSG
jgi:CheY-like chemotaxis protein